MAEFKVDLDPNDVNQKVAQAILDSTLGNIIKDSIGFNLRRLMDTNYGPITSAIDGIIAQIIKEELEKHKEEIRTIIAGRITDVMLADAMKKFEAYLERKY